MKTKKIIGYAIFAFLCLLPAMIACLSHGIKKGLISSLVGYAFTVFIWFMVKIAFKFIDETEK